MSAPSPPLARPTTLLLVDDDPASLRALQRLLRGEGYRVLTAPAGEEGLRLVASEAVDIVLSDIDMPDMNGLEVMSRLRRNHPRVVRLLLTGRASLSYAMSAINDGEVFRFMTKPCDVDELREVLRQAAARAAQNRARADAQQDQQQRGELLAALEREQPGITSVVLTQGVYDIEPRRLRASMARLGCSTLTLLWPAGER